MGSAMQQLRFLRQISTNIYGPEAYLRSQNGFPLPTKRWQTKQTKGRNFDTFQCLSLTHVGRLMLWEMAGGLLRLVERAFLI